MTTVHTGLRPVSLAENIYIYHQDGREDACYETPFVQEGVLFHRAVVRYESRSHHTFFQRCIEIFQDSVISRDWLRYHASNKDDLIWVKKVSLVHGIPISPKTPLKPLILFTYDSKKGYDFGKEAHLQKVVYALEVESRKHTLVAPFCVKGKKKIIFRPVVAESVFSLHFGRELKRGFFILQKLIENQKLPVKDSKRLIALCNPIITALNTYAQKRGLIDWHVSPLAFNSLQELGLQEPFLWKHISQFIHSDTSFREDLFTTFCRNIDHDRYLHLHYGFLPQKILEEKVLLPALQSAAIDEKTRFAFQYCHRLDLLRWMTSSSIFWSFDAFKKIIEETRPSFTQVEVNSEIYDALYDGTLSQQERHVKFLDCLPNIFKALDYILRTYRKKITELFFINFDHTQLAFELGEKGPLRMLCNPVSPYPLKNVTIANAYCRDDAIRNICLSCTSTLQLIQTSIEGSGLLNPSFQTVENLYIRFAPKLQSRFLEEALSHMHSLKNVTILGAPVTPQFLQEKWLQNITKLDIRGCKNIPLDFSVALFPALTLLRSFEKKIESKMQAMIQASDSIDSQAEKRYKQVQKYIKRKNILLSM